MITFTGCHLEAVPERSTLRVCFKTVHIYLVPDVQPYYRWEVPGEHACQNSNPDYVDRIVGRLDPAADRSCLFSVSFAGFAPRLCAYFPATSHIKAHSTSSIQVPPIYRPADASLAFGYQGGLLADLQYIRDVAVARALDCLRTGLDRVSLILFNVKSALEAF